MNRETGRILSNDEAGAGYRLLRLSLPVAARCAVPGQFVHLRVPGLDASSLRRPLSICDADAASGRLEILYKVVGRGTEALSKARAGDAIDAIGPLGNGFPSPDPARRPVLVGGGYGVAPLHFLARTVLSASLSRPSGAARPILFAGARTAADLLLVDRFEALGAEVRIATDDGSRGARGLVTAALDEWLASEPGNGPGREVFACGPAPMLRPVEERATAAGAPAWLSLDRRMACGVGACFGCTQAVRAADGSRTLARVCSDGPVFPAGRLVWDG